MLQYTSDNRKSNEYWNSQKSVKQNNKIINLKLSGAVVTQKKEDNVSKLIDLSFHSYLGLNQNKQLKLTTCNVINEFGCGILKGITSYHEKTEDILKSIYQFPSCYTLSGDGNSFIIPLIVGKNDAIFIDECAKTSINDSAELSNSKIYYYKHNNASGLEACLLKASQELPNSKKLIIIEGVYNITGEISNLVEFINVSKKFGGIVLVDESHALGVLGKEGKGSLEYANIHEGVDVITGSLEYSLCSNGSYILLNNELSKQFNDLIFINDTITPLSAAISSTTLDILRQDSKTVDQLKNNVSWWRSHCQQNGIELIDSNSAISAIRIDDKGILLNLQRRLYDEGLNVMVSTRPYGLLKFILSASLTEDLLEEAMDILLRVIVNEFPQILKVSPPKIILDSKNPTEEYSMLKDTPNSDRLNLPLPKIAIIGVGCRLPGDILTKDDFWNMLVTKRVVTTEIPADRWDRDEWYSDEPIPGTIQTKHGGFLTNAYDFDNKYFSISQAEALEITPEQRWLCELAVETMEDANIRPEELKGSQTGVFVGSAGIDFGGNQLVNTLQMSAHTMTGLEPSIFSNRISYIFDLHGPSITSNTACSASMSSLSMACNAIAVGDCDKAFVAGSNFLPSPGGYVAFSQLRVVSKTGSCKPFDEKADGYARLEGACMLLIKDYEKAVRDNDKIYACIIGSGTNEDGRTLSITMPSSDAQCTLMKWVCEKSNIKADTIDYVEAHGTGTPTGDPIEARSIGNAFGKAVRAPGSKPLPVGTVKGNVGHGEFLSGAIGLLKTSLMLFNKQLVPTAAFEKLNPKIDVSGLGIRVADKNEPMVKLNGKENTPLRAAVNSFGFGGANANAILESVEKIDVETVDIVKKENTLPLMVSFTGFSAKALIATIKEYLELPVEQLLPKLYLMTTTRQVHTHRVTFLLDNANEFYELASAFIENRPHPKVIHNLVKASFKQGITFVFRGMSQLNSNIGYSLYQYNQKFAEIVDYCDKVLEKVSGGVCSLKREFGLFQSENLNFLSLQNPKMSIIGNGMIQLALGHLLKSYGIKPSSVVGYNSGEIAAAYTAGIISLEDAILVLYQYSTILEKVPNKKNIFTLELGCSAGQAQTNIINQLSSTIYISGNNADNICTLCGSRESLNQAVSIAQQNGIPVLSNLIPGSCGICTPYLNDFKDEFFASLKGIGNNCKTPVIKFISTTLGQPFNGPLNEYYWWANLSSTVNFSHALSLAMNEQQKGSGYILDVGSGYANAALFTNYFGAFTTADKIFTTYDTTGSSSNEALTLLYTIVHLFERNAIPLPAMDKIWENSADVVGVDSFKKIRSVNFILPPHVWEHKKIKKIYNKEVFISLKKNQELNERQKEQIKLTGGVAIDHDDKLSVEIEKLKKEINDITQKDAKKAQEVAKENAQRMKDMKKQFELEKEEEIKKKVDEEKKTILKEARRFITREIEKAKNSAAEAIKATKAAEAAEDISHSFRNKNTLSAVKDSDSTSKPTVISYSGNSEAWNFENHKYLVDHIVGKDVVFPAAGSISRAMYGFKQSRGEYNFDKDRNIVFENLEFLHLAVFEKSVQEQLNKKGPIPISLVEEGDGKYTIVQKNGNPVSKGQFYEAQLTQSKEENSNLLSDVPTFNEFINRCSTKVGGNGVTSEQLYHRTDELGLKYGPNFRLVQNCRAGDNVGYARIKVDEEKSKLICHPAVLDACFHSIIGTGIANGDRQPLPNKIRRFVMGRGGYFPQGTIICAADIIKQDLKNVIVNIYIYDEDKKPIAKIEEMDMTIRQLNVLRKERWIKYMGEEVLTSLTHDQLPIQNCTGILVIGEKSQENEINYSLLPRLAAIQPLIYMILDSYDEKFKAMLDANVLVPQTTLVIDVRYLANPSIDYAYSTMKLLIENNFNFVYGNIEHGDKLIFNETYENMAFGNSIAGLLQVARAESKTNKIYSIQAENLEKFTHGLLRGNLTVEDPDIRVKEDFRITAQRIIKEPVIPEIKTKNYTLEHSNTGQIGKLKFREVFGLPECGPDEVIIKIHSVALQFKDIMSVMNNLPGYNVYEPGMESNGYVVKIGENAKKHIQLQIGQPVFAFTHKYGHMVSTYGKAHYKLVKPMNTNDMNPESYSSVIVLGTVLYALRDRAGGVKRGQSILIHSGAGGVGQAAIKLCQYWGAKIFVSTSAKKVQYLKDMYGLEYITNSRDSKTFYNDIMKWTNNEGVDFVLNALAGDGITYGLKCLKKGGHFVEIGKKNIIFNTPLGLKSLMNNINFCSAHIDLLDVDKLSSLMNESFELLNSGKITPIPVTLVPIKQYLSAFFNMASGNNVGKTCLVMDDSYEPNCKPVNLVKENKAYLITGAFGGVGLRVAEWLQLRGAKNIVLTTSGNIEKRNRNPIVETLRSKGVHVTVTQCDISNIHAVRKLFQETTPQIAGIFHLANKFAPGLIQRTSLEQFHVAYNPKARGALNLHLVSKDYPIDMFVMFSSVLDLLGNKGQAAYGAANSFLGSLVELRRSQGLCGSCLSLPAMKGSGYLAQFKQERQANQFKGLITMLDSDDLPELLDDVIHYSMPPSVLLLDEIAKMNVETDEVAPTTNVYKHLRIPGAKDSVCEFRTFPPIKALEKEKQYNVPKIDYTIDVNSLPSVISVGSPIKRSYSPATTIDSENTIDENASARNESKKIYSTNAMDYNNNYTNNQSLYLIEKISPKGISNDDVIVKSTDKIVILTLNRPESMNDLHTGMIKKIIQAIDVQKSLIIENAGDNFCMGWSSLNAETETIESVYHYYSELINKMNSVTQPIISICKGIVFGGGMIFPCMSDIVIADNNTTFSFYENTFKQMPFILTKAAQNRIKSSHIKKMFLIEKEANIEEAINMELVDIAVASNKLEMEKKSVIRRINTLDPSVLKITKENINDTELSLEGALIRSASKRSVLPTGQAMDLVSLKLVEPKIYLLEIKTNIVNLEVASQIGNSFEQMKEKNDAHVLIIKNASNDFCQGFDAEFLNSISGKSKSQLANEIYHIYKNYSKTYELTIPVLCCLSGSVMNAGLNLALTSDWRVASRESCLSFINKSNTVDSSVMMSHSLQDFVGRGKSFNILFNYDNKTSNAVEAYKQGIVQELVANPNQLMDIALTKARVIASAPLKGINHSLNLMRIPYENSLLMKEAYTFAGILKDRLGGFHETVLPRSQTHFPSQVYNSDNLNASKSNRSVTSKKAENVGIIGLASYIPSTTVNMSKLEVHDNCQGKYTISLGQKYMSLTAPNEDVVSMALNAVKRLMKKMNLKPSDIGRIQIGTETPVDLSKSVKTFIVEQFFDQGITDIEGVDNVNACFGSTAALFDTVAWMQSEFWNGRYAIVVGTDISQGEDIYHFLTGSSAVAVLIGPNANLVVEPNRGIFSNSTFDFYKPYGYKNHYPVVDGKYSIKCYLDSLKSCYEDLKKKTKSETEFLDHQFGVFHNSSVSLTRKGFNTLMEMEIPKVLPNAKAIEKRKFISKIYKERVEASTLMTANMGCMYNASVLNGIISLNESLTPDDIGKRALVYSFGSGSVGALWTLRIDGLAEKDDLVNRLSNRKEVSVDTYFEIRKLWLEEIKKFGRSYKKDQFELPIRDGDYYFASVSYNGVRKYEIA
jgi:acyl transferase domain-containing protein/3-hydroxy-3-methylglutaryl CoA synthase/7-keto-8-aminopelargonate synthetase-like enzyme/enoyl-CoA hydratase/carnithine racemase/NADPH:quinone reductase-like Zn-dependent oxidoreductase